MEKEKLLEIVGYVKVSIYRTKTLKFIGDGRKMPSEIGKELGITTSHASNILRALKKYNLVICTNPNVRKGRLYENTDLAKEVLNNLD
ncbi:transcriptional regulator [uncultured Methanobrevibacter sp.]|uniref:transcriptional regulator n=1 Tax=uncultured Methanobrevibacter sp. TaxID=253161 RepID=UPI0025DBD2FC|nr:transcriptional regulator [uncultured Methanobrevibacter sp.]